MSVQPVDDLALKAIEQRHQLHDRADELKGKIQVTREKLDIKRNARERFGSAAIVVAAVGLLSGFATGGMFTRR
jgi:hypothetical protein